MKAFSTPWLLLGLLIACPLAQGYQLPDLGSSSYSSLPPAEEQRLGSLFMQQVRQSVAVVHDPVLNHYLDDLGKKLVAHSTIPQRHVDFFMIDSADVNAFAGPAAHIGVNAGTLLLAENEAELASVLAHEITHVSQHHLARALEKARGSTLTALATVAAALIVGSATGQGDMAMGGLMAAQSLSMENQLGYSRDNEREADRIGLELLHQSQFDPQAMPRFLTRMAKRHVDLLDGRFSYLRTHPINEERIADAKARADDYPPADHTDSLTFKLMQMRLLALTGPYSPTKIKHAELALTSKTSNALLAERYGLALLLYRGRKLPEAEQRLRALHQEYPENSVFSLSLADIYLAEQNLNAAEKLLEKSLQADPEYPPLLLSYANVLLQQNRATLALPLLERFLRQHPHTGNTIELLEALATAQAQNGLISRAYLTRARIQQATDQPEHARLQAQQALKYAAESDKAFIKNELLLAGIPES